MPKSTASVVRRFTLAIFATAVRLSVLRLPVGTAVLGVGRWSFRIPLVAHGLMAMRQSNRVLRVRVWTRTTVRAVGLFAGLLALLTYLPRVSLEIEVAG